MQNIPKSAGLFAVQFLFIVGLALLSRPIESFCFSVLLIVNNMFKIITGLTQQSICYLAIFQISKGSTKINKRTVLGAYCVHKIRNASSVKHHKIFFPSSTL